MNEQKMLADQVKRWRAEGRWRDEGEWMPGARRGEIEYHPTPGEIAAKTALFRTLGGRGAGPRTPRGGRFAVATTRGIC